MMIQSEPYPPVPAPPAQAIHPQAEEAPQDEYRRGGISRTTERRLIAAGKGAGLVAGSLVPGIVFSLLNQPIAGLAIGGSIGAVLGASVKSQSWVKALLVMGGTSVGIALAVMGAILPPQWMFSTLVAGTIMGAGFGYVAQAMVDALSSPDGGAAVV
ncbi:MAG: hypothetical protein AB1758_01145 [Candidatus Eremiobacterota bacterium]